MAIDIEFARNMFELHKKVSSTEIIVGWCGLTISSHAIIVQLRACIVRTFLVGDVRIFKQVFDGS